jgi:hypothetical protein
MIDYAFQNRLRLNLQWALLGAITENLRAVAASVDDHLIRLSFFFDGPFSEDDHERCEIVATEVIADYTDFPDLKISTNVLECAVPQPLKAKEEDFWVYKRFEAN